MTLQYHNLFRTTRSARVTHRLPMENFRRGVAAPTATIRNNLAGYLFAADAEELFIQFCVPKDWNQTSDILLEVFCILNQDEAINDLIDWETVVISVAEHEDADTSPTQTPGANHDIEAFNSGGTEHIVEIALDYDDGTCPIKVGDNVTIRISRTANVGTSGYVAGVIVTDICIAYQIDVLGETV